MRRGAPLLAALFLLALPAGAAAATRYASPDGGTVPGCPQITPCSLAYAIEAAAPEDEVAVNAGLYEVTESIKGEVPLTIRGQGGQRPRIVGAKGVTPLRLTERAAVEQLRIESTDAGLGSLFAVGDGSSFDHLELISGGEEAASLRPGNSFTLTNSLLFAQGSGVSVALFLQGTANGGSQLRNDTIVANGGQSIAIGLFAAKDSQTIMATNVIAEASTDVSAKASPEFGGAALVTLDHSSFDSSEGNVTATAQIPPPQFVNAEAGDYHQLPSSPTVDAGVNSPENGALDLDLEGRAQLGRPTCTGPDEPLTDVGADELPAQPRPVCVPDTKIVKLKRRGRRVKIRFRASGVRPPIQFKCKLDRGRPRRCRSPKTYRQLSVGRHLFKVWAVAGGVADRTPAKRRFRIPPGGKRRSAR